MSTETSCYICREPLKGEWKIIRSKREKSNVYGRFIGIQGFLVTTFHYSDENGPGWVTAYCADCWESGILAHPTVEAKLEEEEKKLSNEEIKTQVLQEENARLIKELTAIGYEIGNERNLSKLRDEEIINLKKEITSQESLSKELSLKLEAEQLQKTQLEQALEIQNELFKKTLLKNAEAEELKDDAKNMPENTPTLSIQMDTLLDLNQSHGWRIKSSDHEGIKPNKFAKVVVIGMCGVGKSWFCNQLAGKKLSKAGSNQRTESLDCYFPTEEGDLIGIIDTPGSNSVIRYYREDLVQQLEASLAKRRNSIETPEEASESYDKSLLYYELLKNDARILQGLKDKFIGELADVLILICNRLAEKDQDSIFKIVEYHNKIKMKLIQEQKLGGGAVQRESLLYIVHNYSTFSEVDQVEKQIQRDLEDSFKIEKVPLFCSEQKLEGCNKVMYQDQFGISHLILAAKGTKAGAYYNQPAFDFLKGKINRIESRTQTEVKKLLLDFCNKNIPLILQQENLKLLLNADKTAIVKADDSPNLMLENVHHGEFDSFLIWKAFEPKYSVIRRKKDDNITEVTVEMELIDSKFKATLKPDSEGYWCLIVEGNKRIPEDSGVKDVYLRQDRERGQFDVKIRLLNFVKPTVKRDPPGKEETKDGIVRWTFEFKNDPQDSLI